MSGNWEQKPGGGWHWKEGAGPNEIEHCYACNTTLGVLRDTGATVACPCGGLQWHDGAWQYSAEAIAARDREIQRQQRIADQSLVKE